MNMHFKNRETSPSTTHHIHLLLNEYVVGKRIAHGPVDWPPTFPDFTLLDYCLWDWIKSEVCKLKLIIQNVLFAQMCKFCCPHKLFRDSNTRSLEIN